MRYLSLAEVTELHRLVIEASGGSHGIRDLGALESAIAQPRMTFGGEDLYKTPVEKAAALGFALVRNHEQEELMLALAAGDIDRSELRSWLREHVRLREL